jgi:hypothetical protein
MTPEISAAMRHITLRKEVESFGAAALPVSAERIIDTHHFVVHRGRFGPLFLTIGSVAAGRSHRDTTEDGEQQPWHRWVWYRKQLTPFGRKTRRFGRQRPLIIEPGDKLERPGAAMSGHRGAIVWWGTHLLKWALVRVGIGTSLRLSTRTQLFPEVECFTLGSLFLLRDIQTYGEVQSKKYELLLRY